MSVLNPKFNIIESYKDIEYREFDAYEQPTTGLALLMREFTHTNDIWYCMITLHKSLRDKSFIELMGEETYRKVISKSAYLVIDLPFEPFYDCIDAIYEVLIENNNIPPSQIILMSNMYDAYAYNLETAKKHNSNPINIFYFSALEYMLSQYMNSHHPKGYANKFYPKKLVKDKVYPKSFLCLNRRWRPHRPLFILLLWFYKLLDKGYVSFGPSGDNSKDNWDYIYDGLKCATWSNAELFKIIDENEQNIKHIPFMYLDIEDLHMNQADVTTSADVYYENSYFSVIPETTFYYKENSINSRFITEKTYKAIAMKHPFVLLTIPKSLELLKHLGYKTFSPYIDESYDQELDDNKRLLMIIKEVDRLANLNKEQLENFIENVLPICEHNYNLLRNKTKFIYRNYLDVL